MAKMYGMRRYSGGQEPHETFLGNLTPKEQLGLKAMGLAIRVEQIVWSSDGHVGQGHMPHEMRLSPVLAATADIEKLGKLGITYDDVEQGEGEIALACVKSERV